MAPVLKVLEFLRIARDYIRRFPGRGASLLAFLGHKLNTWCRFWLEIFGRPKPGERRFIGSEKSSYSVSGRSAVVGECVVAASSVPASASLHEHEHTESTSQLASTRLTHPPRLETISALPPTYGDDNVNPVVQPSASSNAHEPLSPPPICEARRRRSSTSVVVDTQNSSTVSLSISSSPNPPQMSDEPFAMDSSPVHLSPDSFAVDLRDESLPGSPTPSNHTSKHLVPEGRIVQLINSDQIPRYDKSAKMQVGYHPIITHLHFFADPAWRQLMK